MIGVDGLSVAVEQPIAAREVLRLGGILGDGLVIRVDAGRASHFDPLQPVAFEAPAHPVFRTFRGALHRLHVNGLRWDWGMPFISEEDVRRIAGIAPDVPIRINGTRPVLPPGQLIDLTVMPPPRLSSRQRPRRN
jgi:hypothetical protein